MYTKDKLPWRKWFGRLLLIFPSFLCVCVRTKCRQIECIMKKELKIADTICVIFFRRGGGEQCVRHLVFRKAFPMYNVSIQHNVFCHFRCLSMWIVNVIIIISHQDFSCFVLIFSVDALNSILLPPSSHLHTHSSQELQKRRAKSTRSENEHDRIESQSTNSNHAAEKSYEEAKWHKSGTHVQHS